MKKIMNFFVFLIFLIICSTVLISASSNIADIPNLDVNYDSEISEEIDSAEDFDEKEYDTSDDCDPFISETSLDFADNEDNLPLSDASDENENSPSIEFFLERFYEFEHNGVFYQVTQYRNDEGYTMVSVSDGKEIATTVGKDNDFFSTIETIDGELIWETSFSLPFEKPLY